MKRLLSCFALLVLVGCGTNRYADQPTKDTIDVEASISALEAISESLQTLIESEYASCANTGDASDALLRKICEVAQAATSEVQAQFLAQLGTFQNILQSQIDQVRTDLINEAVALDTRVTAAESAISTINTDITNLTSRMTTAENSITAIEAYLNAAQSSPLNGSMKLVFIGSENTSAGPVYEALLRRKDKTRINAYMETYETSSVTIANNGISSTNASPVVAITATAHSYSSGNIVKLSGVFVLAAEGTGFISAEGTGFISSDFNSRFFVITVTDADHFTITMSRNATATTTFGTNNMAALRLLGRQMSTIWGSNDASDTTVRQTSVGTTAYNFIVRQKSDSTKAEICYDQTNASASFATINAASEGGAGNIVCK